MNLAFEGKCFPSFIVDICETVLLHVQIMINLQLWLSSRLRADE